MISYFLSITVIFIWTLLYSHIAEFRTVFECVWRKRLNLVGLQVTGEKYKICIQINDKDSNKVVPMPFFLFKLNDKLSLKKISWMERDLFSPTDMWLGLRSVPFLEVFTGKNSWKQNADTNILSWRVKSLLLTDYVNITIKDLNHMITWTFRWNLTHFNKDKISQCQLV